MAKALHPEPDEFEAWKAGPVAQWFFRFLELEADTQRKQWESASWNAGVADQHTLDLHRGKAEGLRYALSVSHDQIVASLEEE